MEDQDTEELLRKLAMVEFAAEELLLARRQLVETDGERNKTREALGAMKGQARHSKSSRFSQAQDEDVKCRTCGDGDGSRPVWKMFQGADVFVRLPFHQVHCELENAQRELDANSKRLHSLVKEKTYILSEKGALADIISPSLVESMVKLQG